MTFTGLTGGQVAALFAAVGALTLVLYLLKLRRRTVQVPFVQLWETVLADQKTARLFSSLKRWLSLLLALAIGLALSVALGDPRAEGSSAEARTIVALLDVSASMQSTDVAPSRFEAAREALGSLIDGLGPDDRLLIATLGRAAAPVAPMSGDPGTLRRALADVVVTDATASVAPGLALAADILRGAQKPEVIVYTDGATPVDPERVKGLLPADVKLAWLRFGEASDNVGIGGLAARRYPLDKSQSEVLLELFNADEVARRVELTLLGDGEAIDVQRLHLAPGERARRFFSNISGADTTLEARIRPLDGRPDHLASDDRAYARLPPRRRARVQVVTDGENLYLEAALLLDEYLDVSTVGPDAYDPDAPHDVVIFDRTLPPVTPKRPALYLAPTPRDGAFSPLAGDGIIESPYFARVDRRHPLTAFTALADVNIAEARVLRPEREDTVVGADPRGPLLVTGARGGVPFVALAFDVRSSDLPLRVAWPLLLLNTIDYFGDAEAGFASSYETGTTWHVPVAATAERARVTGPDGRTHGAPIVDGRAVFEGAKAGFYTVEAAGQQQVIAANIGIGDESRIAPGEALTIDGRSAAEPSRGTAGAREAWWVMLVGLVLAVLFVEWVSYHRRWTV